MYCKKKIKTKVFEEKFGTLGKNDVIEKMLMSSNFFSQQRVLLNPPLISYGGQKTAL